MKTKKIYKELKEKYNHYLVLLKVGAFYICLDDDAIILNYLFDYQINNDKVGFPIKMIDKIILGLKEKEVNYLLYEENNIKEEQVFANNTYMIMLNKSKKKIYDDKMQKFLIDRIKELICLDSSNYSKIKDFIDEL